MGDVADFMRKLFRPENKDMRKDFFLGGENFIRSEIGEHVDREDLAAIYAMNRQFMIEWVADKENEDISEPLLTYDFQSDGRPWDPGDVNAENPCAGGNWPAAGDAASANVLEGFLKHGAGAAWSDPRPHISRIHPTVMSKSDETIELLVAGEGILDEAKFVMSSRSTGKRATTTLKVCTDGIKNMRRIYLKGRLRIAELEPANDYVFFVMNSRSTGMIEHAIVNIRVDE